MQKVGNCVNAEATILFFRDNSLTLKTKITNEIKESKMTETKEIKVKQNAMNPRYELMVPKWQERHTTPPTPPKPQDFYYYLTTS